MTEVRDTQTHFHTELAELEQKVLGMVDRAEDMVGRAVEAVTTNNVELAEQVVEDDKGIDATYFEVHNEWTSLMARHQPLGSDLRRMTVLLHLNTTFGRMGDQCVNIARVALASAHLPSVDRISGQIREMGDLVRPMIRTAMEAYVREDLDEARLLPAMDHPVDRLNANMYKETVAAGGSPHLLEWAARMLLVARALERVGDQSVDFAEQTAYLITGDRTGFGQGPPVDDDTG